MFDGHYRIPDIDDAVYSEASVSRDSVSRDDVSGTRYAPVITDPVQLLYNLEEQLAHSEAALQSQIAQIEARLAVLEDTVDGMSAGCPGDIEAIEKEVIALAERLGRLENPTG